MAKRPTRSEADDTPSAPSQPKSRRSRASTSAAAGGAASESATTQAARGSVADQLPADVDRRMGALTSESMASEPSEDDIRMRAYQRYLERGASHGMDFDDWLEAERELRATKTAH